MPGAFEAGTVSRRRFMTGSVHAAGGIAAAAFTLPALGFAIGPVFDRPPAPWQDDLILDRTGASGGQVVVRHNASLRLSCR